MPVVKGDHLRCQMLSSRQLDAGKVLCYVGKPSCITTLIHQGFRYLLQRNL